MHLSEFVGSSEARQRYWARSFVGWRRFSAARPNASHDLVTALQRAGAVGQRVEKLHRDPVLIIAHAHAKAVVFVEAHTDAGVCDVLLDLWQIVAVLQIKPK